MSFCTNCGTKLYEDSVFCTACGARVPVKEPESVPTTPPEPVAMPVEEPSPTDIPVDEPAPVAEKVYEESVIGQTQLLTPEMFEEEEAPVPAKDDSCGCGCYPPNNGAQGFNAPPPPYNAAPQMPVSQAPYDGEPAKEGKFGVVSTGYYFLFTILYSMPVVGLILSIVMSFGGTKNKNKINLAKSYLIMNLIGFILTCLALILVIALQDVVLGALGSAFEQDFDSWKEFFDYMRYFED